MGYDDPDLYYQPEKFDLLTVGEVEWDGESYNFNITAVWQSKADSKLFYWASDSGCSCPSPFEAFTSLEGDGDYEVHKGTKQEVIKWLLDELERSKEYNSKYSWHTYDPSNDVLELVGKLVKL